MPNKRGLLQALQVLILLYACSWLIACGGTSSGESNPIYYIDATGGDDSRSGLSPTSAWKTFGRLASAAYAGTTTILLKRDEVWAESLNLSHSRLVIDAYGTGNAPRIDGSVAVTGWVDTGGGIYSHVMTLVAGQALGNLSANGTMLQFVPWDDNAATSFASAPDNSYSYEYATQTLYLKTATDPATQNYLASVLLRGIYANSLGQITIRHIDVTRVSLNGIELKNCTSCSVSDSNVTRVGGAVIGPNTVASPDYLYAGNGIDFSNSSSNGSVTDVSVAEVFDSCLAIEIYESNHTADNIQLHNAAIDRCGFAGVEISVLRNVNTINSIISNVDVMDMSVTQCGQGWSGRRYGSEGHGLRIKADDNAGSMSNIRVSITHVSGAAGDGVYLGGEVGDVVLHRLWSEQNSGHGIEVAAVTATSLQLDLSSSIIAQNNMNGVSFNAPAAAGMQMFHNTFYDNAINLAIYNLTGDADIRNNLFYNDVAGTHLYSAVNLPVMQLNNNCYNDMVNMIGYNMLAYATLADFQMAYGHEANGLGDGVIGLSDPVNGDFSLTLASDCRILGAAGTGITEDYAGNAFASPPSSGAYAAP